MICKKHSKFLKIVVPIAVVAVAIAIALTFISGPEKTAKKYLKASVKGDGETVYKLVMNPFELEYRLGSEYYSYENEQSIIDVFTSKYSFSSDMLKNTLGDNLKAKVKIKNITKYSKSDIEAVNKYLSVVRSDNYELNSLQDICVVTTETTIKGSKLSDTRTDEMVVYKLNGKWYVSADAFCPAGFASKDSIGQVINTYGKN